jgi:penicillin V acylase-like amidase (Ntn superfamily)
MQEHNRQRNYLIGLIHCLTIVLLTSVYCRTSVACTAFCVTKDESHLLEKNLDWPIGDGLILVNKRGLYKEAYIKGKKRLAWTSKYGSITFNQFGKEFPLGGMNEKGLVIEELNSWGQPPVNDSAYLLNELQWVQYCLDNCSCIKEIIGIKDSILVEPLFLNLHYLITDSKGDILIVEYYEGVSHFIYGREVEYPVLSNNHYNQSLKYIRNFKGFGGNMNARSNTSGERFVKAASMIRDINDSINIKDQAFGILDAVKQNDTQWSIVYDIKKRSVSFKTAKDEAVKTINFGECNFMCSTPILYVNVNQAGNRTGYVELRSFVEEENVALINDVCSKYEQIYPGDDVKAVFKGLMDYGNAIKCR